MNEQIINKILKKYTGLDFEKDKSLMSENLFGNKIGIAPRTMVQIYVELKRNCEQESMRRAVVSGNFKTYNDLLMLLKNSY